MDRRLFTKMNENTKSPCSSVKKRSQTRPKHVSVTVSGSVSGVTKMLKSISVTKHKPPSRIARDAARAKKFSEKKTLPVTKDTGASKKKQVYQQLPEASSTRFTVVDNGQRKLVDITEHSVNGLSGTSATTIDVRQRLQNIADSLSSVKK